MPKRAIRIVKHIGAAPCVAVCTFCSQQFKVSTPDLRSVSDATTSLQAQFDAHKCKLIDSSQNALRIVKEATEHD
jgi:hypothetical protein